MGQVSASTMQENDSGAMPLTDWVTKDCGFHLATRFWSLLVLHTLRAKWDLWGNELRMPQPRSTGNRGCLPVGFEELKPTHSMGAWEQSFSQEHFTMVTAP